MQYHESTSPRGAAKPWIRWALNTGYTYTLVYDPATRQGEVTWGDVPMQFTKLNSFRTPVGRVVFSVAPGGQSAARKDAGVAATDADVVRRMVDRLLAMLRPRTFEVVRRDGTRETLTAKD